MKKFIFLFALLFGFIQGHSVNILTPTGYKNASTLHIGDTVIGLENGIQVKNVIVQDSGWTDSTDVYNQGSFDFYKINGTWNLYKNQSIWSNSNVNHVFQLRIGDTIINSAGASVIINSIVKDTDVVWYRLEVSGNHTYIQDNIVLHNASRFWVGGGSSSNWNATSNTNWSATSGGSNNASVPASTDAVTFDGAGASGNSNSTISAAITINSFTNTTGYTSTITSNNILSIAGNVTTATGINWAGSSAWNITNTSTFTSGGVTFVPPLTLTNTFTLTLSGNLTVSGLFTKVTGTTTLAQTASETLTLSGGLTATASIIPGPVTIFLTGGTWSGAGIIGAAGTTGGITFQGTVTVSGTVNFATGVLTYTSGTITTTGSTLQIEGASTLNTNGITWNTVNFNVAATNVTLTSNMACGLLEWSSSTTVNQNTTQTITASGGLTMAATPGIGTATVILTGGTWSGNFQETNPLTFQGNITVSGTVQYGRGTLTYTSGTITTTSSTINFSASCTINTNGMIWNNVQMTSASVTYTLTSNMACSGLLTVGLSSNGVTINGFTISSSGGVTFANTSANILTGTTTINITGGTVTPNNSTGAVENPVTVAGNVTWSTGYLCFGNNTFTFTSGTQTFNNGFGIYLKSVGNSTLTNNISGLTGLGIKFDGLETYTINGSNGIGFTDFNLLLNNSTAQTITLLFGNTYSMSSSIQSSMSGAITTTNYPIVKSSSAGNKVPLTLSASATQHLERTNFTDIDASAGQTIFDYSPNVSPITLSNTLNINDTPTQPVTVSKTFTK